jgi:hypothetical protein
LRLWAFLLSVYWLSFVTYFILWKSYKHVSNLRAAARSTSDVKPEEFAVLVRDVPIPPPDQSIKDSVDSYFRALHPDTFYKAMVVTDIKKVCNPEILLGELLPFVYFIRNTCLIVILFE